MATQPDDVQPAPAPLSERLQKYLTEIQSLVRQGIELSTPQNACPSGNSPLRPWSGSTRILLHLVLHNSGQRIEDCSHLSAKVHDRRVAPLKT